MPKDICRAPAIIVIGASVVESAANTFTQERVDLQLNPLDNEVFVVTGIDMDVGTPDAIAATDTKTTMAITTTSQTDICRAPAELCRYPSNCKKNIRAAGFVDGGVSFQEAAGDTPPATLDYIGIIATNDFFLQFEGSGNTNSRSGSVKVYGYRARAEASTYAALVQSEVLSS